MAKSSAAQLVDGRQQRPSFSQDHHTLSYVQYHDDEQELHWAEPVEQHPSRHYNPHPHGRREPRPRPQHVATIKRRPVNPIISTKPPPPDIDENPLLSPIIPSPLRIRRPKDPRALQMSPTPARSVRLLVASIGNPPPYHTTRHSAGHILLKSLATRLNLPPPSVSKALGSGSSSFGADVGRPEYTLWQSSSMMNVSGTGTLKAWKLFNDLQRSSSSDIVTALVVLHDELESSTGTIKLRRGESSPRGHNGIKSIQQSLRSGGQLGSLGDCLIKIGIGISRPSSRDSHDVSAWVLGQLTHVERSKIEAATESLVAVLESEIGRLERC
ncbi:hypothetical protein A1O3_01247 [Capronia epimyces CBS 606.96]|uniref:peptidyl-tRNA hydrolase n=1 Tax=Capronia epimyces CBS 606.96 TaxID=1182542 RepID=W9YSP6_9EURO|nr:uncharacterized protein A1O3_01247 [Capronia epimyces CBS 606.96]EXJ92695.1 hypothetical protein A1O3_01247 [Capronia epimyces CBS 606.96]